MVGYWSMARPLRIDVENGWYHITARGIERRSIFRARFYYRHFLGLLDRMSARYGVEVHAYCLMGNHYHLIIRTPEANASQAIQWLNVSYSVWFNIKRDRAGHVFQGRFKSVLIDSQGAWLLVASEYLHLNPVRTTQMGLGKMDNRAEGLGLKEPTEEQIAERLAGLRAYEWNSYRAYAGFASAPEWLHTKPILSRGGGPAKYRRGVEAHITRGADPKAFECLRGRVAIGTTAFLEKARQRVGRMTKEQPDRSFTRRLSGFDSIVATVELQTGQKWEDVRNRYGGRTRDLVLYLARMHSGLTLAEIGDRAAGVSYKTVGMAVKRFEAKLSEDKSLRALVERCESALWTVET